MSCTACGNLSKRNKIAGCAARTADGIGCSLVRHLEFVDQALNADGFFQRIQVFALNVFDQRHGQCRVVRHFAHDDRHDLQFGQLRRAPAPFAGDDFITALGQFTRQDRLHHTLHSDRSREFVQRCFVHAAARLVLAGFELFDFQVAQYVVLL